MSISGNYSGVMPYEVTTTSNWQLNTNSDFRKPGTNLFYSTSSSYGGLPLGLAGATYFQYRFWEISNHYYYSSSQGYCCVQRMRDVTRYNTDTPFNFELKRIIYNNWSNISVWRFINYEPSKMPLQTLVHIDNDWWFFRARERYTTPADSNVTSSYNIPQSTIGGTSGEVAIRKINGTFGYGNGYQHLPNFYTLNGSLTQAAYVFSNSANTLKITTKSDHSRSGGWYTEFWCEVKAGSLYHAGND